MCAHCNLPMPGTRAPLQQALLTRNEQQMLTAWPQFLHAWKHEGEAGDAVLQGLLRFAAQSRDLRQALEVQKGEVMCCIVCDKQYTCVPPEMPLLLPLFVGCTSCTSDTVFRQGLGTARTYRCECASLTSELVQTQHICSQCVAVHHVRALSENGPLNLTCVDLDDSIDSFGQIFSLAGLPLVQGSTEKERHWTFVDCASQGAQGWLHYDDARCQKRQTDSDSQHT